MEFLYTLVSQVQDQLAHNQFLSGGIVLFLMAAIGTICREWPLSIYNWLVDRLFLEFEIPQREEAFWWFNDWLAEQQYTKDQARWLTVRTIPSGRSKEPPKIILSPAPGSHWMWWQGIFMVVNRERKEVNPGSGGAMAGGMTQEVFTVSILSWDRSVISRLLTEARDHWRKPDDNRLTIYVPSAFEGWDDESKVRPRVQESVILKQGVLEGLIDDGRKFLASEEWYTDRGIPYRRGYLFHGPPGNGKSSAALAICSALNLDVCILNLGSSTMSDDGLRRALACVPKDSAVLIEDVDCIYIERKSTDDKDNKLTFSGLLNALDGVAASEGRLLFMTTNYRDRLDSALIRPGRCDVHVEFENADLDQAERLYLRFHPDQHDLCRVFATKAAGSSMAQLQGHLLKHAADPYAAADWSVNESQETDEVTKRTQGELGVQAEVCGSPIA